MEKKIFLEKTTTTKTLYGNQEVWKNSKNYLFACID